MTKPAITTRSAKAAALTYAELDTNFTNLRDATITVSGDTGNVINELNGSMTIAGGTGLTSSVSTSTLTLNLDNTAVTPGSYTTANITVDAQGRITSASNGSGGAYSFNTISVSGQSDVVADALTDTLTLVAGSNITLTTNATTDSITISSSNSGGTVTSITAGTGLSGGTITGTGTIALANTAVTAGSYTYSSITVDAQGRITSASSGSAPSTNTFSTIAVSGQSSVVADSSTDTLTLVAGTGITLTTNATTDAITITGSSADLTTNAITVGAANSSQVVISAYDFSSGKSLLLKSQSSSIPSVSDSYLQLGGGTNGSAGSTSTLYAGNGSQLLIESENAIILKSAAYTDIILTPGYIGIPSSDGRIRLNGPIEIQGTTTSPPGGTRTGWLELYIESSTARTAKTITNNGVIVTGDTLNGLGVLSFSNFGSSTNRLSIASTSDFAFGTEDFCIETQVYRSVINVQQHIFDFRTNTSDTGIKLEVYINSSNVVVVSVAGTTLISGGSILTGSGWSGIAVSKFNGTTRLFVGGAPVASVTDTNNYATASLVIGNSVDIASPFDGTLDEIRISKGISRYTTGSFSLDRQPFIDDGNNVLLIHGNTGITDDAVSGPRTKYWLPLYT